jgi:Ca2+-binding EF-hand superfamily protein
MTRTILFALSAFVLVASSLLAADEKEKKDKDSAKPVSATITKVDATKGEITVKFADAKGNSQEKTFQLTKDVKVLDDTGHIVAIDVFQAGNEAVVVEAEGKLKELRQVGNLGRERRLSDSVRTYIELADCEDGCAADLQKIYDMLRRLDTAKDGKIDPKALKAEADNILTERVKGVFSRLDANKDGKISKEEAKGLLKDHFDKIDTNKDGFIDFDELLKAAKEKRDAKAADAKAEGVKPVEKEKN